MTRAYNFGAGPATLPLEVLKGGQAALIDWQNQGMSIVEISHRSQPFKEMVEELETRFRTLLNMPKDYHLLFSPLPSRMHFSLLAENFLKTKADYIISGTWSKMAVAEAKYFGQVHEVANGASCDYLSLNLDWSLNDDADYLYYTPNETLTGLALPFPQAAKVPVIADMTSCILSSKIEVSDYGLIFAGAQKNIAPAGLSIVIISDKLLKAAKPNLPKMNDYAFQIEQKSLYPTVSGFNLYMALLMCRWLMADNRIDGIYQANKEKAALLYDFVDNSTFYQPRMTDIALRSSMNVTFDLQKPELLADFLAKAADNGLLALKGHRSVGGVRASLYNAMPIEGVRALIEFMKAFEKANR